MTASTLLSLSRRTVLAGATLALTPEVGKAGGMDLSTAPGRRFGQVRKFDRARFVEDCVVAGRETDSQAAVRDVLERAVSDPHAVLSDLGAPREVGMEVLHRSRTLTIFAAKWAPEMSLVPHDHRMWALIGIYTGREDNIFWRRTKGNIEAFGANVLFAGDVATLSSDVVHSVTNPLETYTAGLHIYGGDFFDTARSQWNAETLAEEQSNGATIRAAFDHANERTKRCHSG
jgi:predicted metal-dependent enzyme (double-stranded beta helix superfamily)